MNIEKERMTVMKSSKKTLCITAVLLISVITAYAGMNSVFSPTLGIIESNVTLQKCGVKNTSVTFSEKDFDKSLYNDVEYVTIDSLPDSSDGILYLRGTRVLENQTVARNELDGLYFEPAAEKSVCATFGFSDALTESVSAVCQINILEEKNDAPSTKKQTISTQRDISAFKFLLADDPENDGMNFEIVNYPSKGALNFTDRELGAIEYIPKNGYTGKDSFSYVATDEYGNVSPEQTVNINISKPATDKYFDDMKRHWAHNSAIKMSATGLMGGKENGGLLFFEPESNLSRGDFLAISLIMAGLEDEIPYVENTSFADDNAIPSNIRSYAQYALENGIVSGYGSENMRTFRSTDSITRAEAAVIVQRILNLPESTKHHVFKDEESIPSWARASAASLYECGIINGSGASILSLDSPLTKAQGAEMICNVAQYLEDKENEAKKAEKKEKNLFNLFGLIA